jgi:MHS family proline/betaine transporter-like MFS transporter
MSISTFGISFLPVNSSGGIYIYLILACLRIIQGLSAGGEYSGAGLLLIEGERPQAQILNGAILTSTALLGAFAASMAAAIITFPIFPAYSWRVLFFFGGLIGFLTLWLRISIDELKDEAEENKKTKHSWALIFTKHKTALLYTIVCGAMMNVPFQMVSGFINTYFVAIGEYSKTSLMFINAMVVLFCAIVTISLGFFLRRFNPLKVMIFASGSMALFAFPFFMLIEAQSLYLFITAELVLILLSQIFVAPAFMVIAKLFPYELRYRGVAIGNCLGLAFLGGSTPYISSFLISATNISWAPASYLFLISFITFNSSWAIRQKLKKQDF